MKNFRLYKLNLKGTDYEITDWIQVAQNKT
jgi:hypothetical protein